MTPQQQADRIKEIYDEAIKKLDSLAVEREGLLRERQEIIKGHIKELEVQKIEAIRQSLSL
jgi:hypothetical protein